MELSNTQTAFLQTDSVQQTSLHALQTKVDTAGKPADLKEAAQGFEAVFLGQLLNAMDKTIDRSGGLIDGGSTESTFRGMMYQEIAKDMAKSNGGQGVGLGIEVYKQLAEQHGIEAP